MKHFLLLLSIVVLSLGYSQETYTNNREKFVKEFQKSLTEFGKGEYHDFAKKDLPAMLLESNELADDYFSRMVQTCNLMDTKKLKPYPDIYQYVFSVYSLVKGKQSSASFTAWHSSVDKLLDNRNIKKFEDFIEGFVGKTLLNHFVFQKNSLDVLSYEAKKIGVVRKRPSLEKVEFRYVANFLNMRPHKEFYESNKTLINALLPHRINIYKSVIEDIRFKFDEQFQEK